MLFTPEDSSRDWCACPLVGKPKNLAGNSTLNRWVQGPRSRRYLGAFFTLFCNSSIFQTITLSLCRRYTARMNSTLKSKLRRELRARRQNLSSKQQTVAAKLIMHRLIRLAAFRKARHIAAYIASDGEISPAPLLRYANLGAKRCYLPKISQSAASNKMAFYPYHHRQPLSPNQYGIGEPTGLRRQPHPARKLDIVLLPLTGFDKNGRRLGMGGGYYDRAFAFKRNNKTRKPIMIGLAHHCQEVNSLPSDDWDIPLDFIVTDRQVIKAKRR